MHVKYQYTSCEIYATSNSYSAVVFAVAMIFEVMNTLAKAGKSKKKKNNIV